MPEKDRQEAVKSMSKEEREAAILWMAGPNVTEALAYLKEVCVMSFALSDAFVSLMQERTAI